MRLLRYISAVICVCASLAAHAQREVTPVETDDKKPPQPVLHYYDKHGEPLNEPVLFLATLDTVGSAKTNARPVYPCLNSIDIGINIFDAVAILAGQKYGGADIRASLSMWNWLFPTIEIGVAGACNKPKDNNYTYKSSPSVYFKIGADYNFLYKSNPDYRLFAGLRLGATPFSYRITDISTGSSYWQEYQQFSLPTENATALYGEVLLGLRVKIWKQLSLGWSVRFHHLFKSTRGTHSDPWFIPGMGTQSSKVGASFSVTYTLPLTKSDKAANTDTDNN